MRRVPQGALNLDGKRWQGRRRGDRIGRSLLAPYGGDAWAPAKPRPDETLVPQAHRWRRLLDDDTFRSAGEIAEAEGVARSFINRLLRLSLLARDVQATSLEGSEGHSAGGTDADDAARARAILFIDARSPRGGREPVGKDIAWPLTSLPIITVLNSELYEDYRRQVPAVIEKYGGRYLVRGGASEVLEGEWQANRLIVLEFPDMDALQRWYRSDDYQVLLRIRQSAARSNIIAVVGV